MTRMHFEARQTYDPVAGVFVKNGSVQIFALSDTLFLSPLAFWDAETGGTSATRMTATTAPQVPDFWVDDQLSVRWRADGGYTGVWQSYDAILGTVNAALAAVQSARDQVAAASASAAAAQQQVQTLISQLNQNNGSTTVGSGGLSTSALDDYLGGSSQGLLNKLMLPRYKINGVWEARPANARGVNHIGARPLPSDYNNTYDLFTEVS